MINTLELVEKIERKCRLHAAKGKGCSITWLQLWSLTAARRSARPTQPELDDWLMEMLRSGEIHVTSGRFWPRSLRLHAVAAPRSESEQVDPRQPNMFGEVSK